MTFTISNSLFLGFLAFFCTIRSNAQEPKQKRPNIILIMVDDLGYEAIESYGGTSYKTPNINKLAATGMQFNQAYAQPLCTPTRVKLMTGQYNFRNWEAFGILNSKEKTFGHLMQDAGYATCMVGKWQLQSYDPPGYPGSEYRRGTGMKVSDAGFDEYSMFHAAHTEDKGSRYADPTIFQNGKILSDTKGKYGPDIFTGYLNDFVGRQNEKPFFVYYPMALTHGPFTPTPNSSAWAKPEDRLEDNTIYFKDMVEYLDKIIGDIVTNLEEKGLREETLILLYSDNGTHQSITSQMGKRTVRGGKGLTTEAGIRVPFIANWPGQIKAGGSSDEFVDAIDFLPTILEVAETPIPKNFHTDGESFLSVLKEQSANRRDWVFMSYDPKPGWDKDQFAPSEFVLNDNYKLYGDGRFYDIKSDVLEKDTLTTAKISPEASKIKKRFEVILDSLKKYPSYGWIERLDPAFDSLVSKHARIELVAEGFNWSEGPLWQPHGQKIIFSDVPENKIYQWNNLNGLSLYMAPSGYTGPNAGTKGRGSNGLILDPKGDLVLCQVGDRAISKLISLKDSLSPKFEPFITHYKGKRFNSPNDLVYDGYGNLYFTDPSFGLGDKKSDLGFNGVFFFGKNGELRLLDDSIKAPNGIAVSLDNKTLYVADSDTNFPKILAYDLVADGKVSNKRVFFDATELRSKSISKQSPDGIKIDDHGNIFLAGPDGVLIISPNGKHLGTIRTDKKTGNCAFSDDGRYLFITADDHLLRVNLNPYSK
ncbi:sulfatase-like hydrolase/transferase [Arenibacter palladensis]|uniref:sulfatase-like hydrolase/transferase n=1 Tax=Arenibacter palladensis TaxID=237373 RepID=UPI0026E3CCD5|nr:sulfatase-like hydrolase/transferase [Arenibacter palladensis]MDO6602866.1 sulfatase-like hydrolase/transferase [Arenibacter palladensis]